MTRDAKTNGFAQLGGRAEPETFQMDAFWVSGLIATHSSPPHPRKVLLKGLQGGALHGARSVSS
jgi:hypothetical protein